MSRLHFHGVLEPDELVRSISSLAADAYTYPCNPDSPTVNYDPVVQSMGTAPETNFFLDYDGCCLWLDGSDSDTYTKASGNYISAWLDKSGNANHLLQSNAGLQPYLVNENGVDIPYFERETDYLQTASYVPGLFRYHAGSSGFIVVKILNAPTDDDYYFLCDNVGGSISVRLTTVGLYVEGQADYLFDNITSINKIFLFSYNCQDDLVFNLFHNGIFASSHNMTMPSPINNVSFRLGNCFSLDESLRGYMYEVIMFNRQMPDYQRVAIENHLISKWNIS